MDRVRIDDVELEYEVIGSGEPVLLIGHVVADAMVPLTTQPALSDYQLIRYRRRGYGGLGSCRTLGGHLRRGR